MDGVVETFDDHRGYGTLRTSDGTEVFFHCTRIGDGTRTVEVGAPVTFDLVPGLGGRWEAAAVTKMGS
jgi:cold shock CspA family protein